MPEGPSMVILKEEVQSFIGKKVMDVTGNSKQPIAQLKNKKLTEIRTWGKHFIMSFGKIHLRIHFMLFGSYSINAPKEGRIARMHLKFSKGEMNFYACSVQFLEDDPDEIYDWSGDVMNDEWDPKSARKKLKAKPEMLVCDALLDQNIFAGVGNIIKNEVLYRIKVHPASLVGALPPRKLTEMIREARNYSFDFLKWKKEYVLRKHWLAHKKKICMRDGNKIVLEYFGKTNRRAFFCEDCQVLYDLI